MKWSSPLPHFTWHHYHESDYPAWGFYLSTGLTGSRSLALNLYLRHLRLCFHLTWPERSRP